MSESVVAERWVDRLSPSAAFLWVAGVFGLAMAFVTPPLQVPDEPNHWFRADRVAQLQWVDVWPRAGDAGPPYTYGGPVPASIVDCCERFARLSAWPLARVSVGEILAEFRRPLRPELTRRPSFQNTAVYSPVPYAPAAASMAVALALRSPPIVLLYVGRLGTLAGYLALGWTAIRVSPILQWPLAALLTQPMNLFLSAAVSADPLTTTLAYLVTALALRAALVPGEPAGRTTVALAAAAVGLALCKSAYVPVVGTAMAVPGRRWPVGRWVPWAIVLLAAGATASWSALSHPLHIRLLGEDPVKQLAWVRSHPVGFAAVCVRTVRAQAGQLAYNSTGFLGWFDTPMPVWFVIGDLVVLGAITIGFGQPVRLAVRARVLAIAAIGTSAVLVMLADFLIWTTFDPDEVGGLQGRYFLPLVALVGVVLFRSRAPAVRPRWVVAFMATVAMYTLMTVARRYYLPAYAISIG